jgi:hypothetical protein
MGLVLGGDNLVGRATRYGLHGPGLEFRGGGGGKILTAIRAGPKAHPAPCIMDTGPPRG